MDFIRVRDSCDRMAVITKDLSALISENGKATVSYPEIKQNGLPRFGKPLIVWWAVQDSNLRPLD